jgi:thioredoxin 1
MVRVKRFTASWCSPCRALAPIIDGMSNEMQDVEFQTIDIDERPELASEYGIMSIPVVLIENEGKEVERFVGIRSREVYETAINSQRGQHA